MKSNYEKPEMTIVIEEVGVLTGSDEWIDSDPAEDDF